MSSSLTMLNVALGGVTMEEWLAAKSHLTEEKKAALLEEATRLGHRLLAKIIIDRGIEARFYQEGIIASSTEEETEPDKPFDDHSEVY